MILLGGLLYNDARNGAVRRIQRGREDRDAEIDNFVRGAGATSCLQYNDK